MRISTTVAWKPLALLCLLVWLMQTMACLDPPPQCDEKKPCPSSFLCVEGACVCAPGQALCGDQCVLLAQDPDHCGGCGLACGKERQCNQGTCQCAPPLSECNGQCVDVLSDTKHCGRCNIPCPGSLRCVLGRCTNGCPKEQPTPCGGVCVNLQQSPFHCGACNTSCGGEACIAGKCECPTDQKRCGNQCVDLLASRDHCGDCDQKCKDAEVCAAGRCLTQCPKTTPTACFGSCVDLKFNDQHCGGCGRRCTNGQICVDGSCECPPGRDLCNGRCTDLRATLEHCGACSRKCQGGKVCGLGRCLTQCPKVTSTNCGGGCFDTQKDTRHCGACNTRCRGLQVCVEGKCQCPKGFISCEGQCIDPKSHPLHCGKCKNKCGVGDVCGDGQCKPTCPSGTPDLCYGGCFDHKKESFHCGRCGNRCRGGSTCEGGKCVCPKSLSLCNGLCIDPQSDQLNCGQCGLSCPPGERCDQKSCTLDCDTLALCGNVCVDVQTDSTHCGDCNNPCKNGQRCIKGSCSCGPGGGLCDGKCVDLQSDELHCGACKTACEEGKVCVKGKCQRVCTDATLTLCGNTCVDLQSNAQHCGACDKACKPGESCNGGACACPNTQTFCGVCVDTQVDTQHCGACNNQCPAGEYCEKGQCKLCNDAAPTKCGSTCCTKSQTCCNSQSCADLQSDINHCGACNKKCAVNEVCSKGACKKCADGQTRPCYTGPQANRNVGQCADGTQTCKSETWGTCLGSVIPSAEVCDDIDNDCDGQVDETFTTKGDACFAGQGNCRAQGKLVCNKAHTNVECDAKPTASVQEICDGKDNDCDGKVDNNVTLAPDCANQSGVCKGSKKPCVNAVFVNCKAADYGSDHEATETKCDGKDNDCDGSVDEGLDRTGPLCANQKGWCSGSRKSCVAGKWVACRAQEFGVTYQSTETLCDGQDNDCDGTIDEGCSACLPTKALRTLTHLQASRWLAFSPDGKEVAASAFLGNLRLWNTSTGAVIHSIQTGKGPLGLRYSPFFRELAVSRADFAFYDPVTNKLLRALPSHTTQHHLAFGPRGQKAATVGDDKKLLLWDLKTQKALAISPTMVAVADAVAYSPDGKTVATGLQNNEIHVWDPATGKSLQVLKGHTSAVNTVAYSPDGAFLVSTSADKTIRLWNTSTWKQVWSQTASSSVFGAAFRWDSKVLAVGQSIFLELRNVSDGKLATTAIRAHVGAIADVAWSPDGKTVGTSSSDRSVKLWQCP